jgi:hypothetical protein
MRDIIIERIANMLAEYGCKPGDGRWKHFWFDKDFVHVDTINPAETNKQIAANVAAGLSHISQVDWSFAPDAQLVYAFEAVVRQFNRMM